MTAARRESSLSVEEVVEQLIERDEIVLLAAEAIDAARRTRLPGKARALGASRGSLLAEPDAFGQPVKATTLGAQLFARLSVAGLEESN
ncbi:hypothetical protein [Pseudarthrobacter sp. AB1]|uniref:hypothetical protein n=1 Tax=Pseudarthrobacter sp. AB1 TaxID=2138309 RepID=UPI00186B8F85|nr:hypothetical protein [Pseudarthrobacter sp. AB1]